jgi:3',5'-cyclic AMP phosphodiesterase CpdA
VDGFLLVQITDVHLTAEGPLFSWVFPRDNLVAGLATLAEAGMEPDVFLLTGDLANAGDPECYDDLADIMGAAAEASGAEVVYLPGNHDLRAAFRRHLLGRPDGSGPINQVHRCGGLRIVALDSVVPGQDGGDLAEETLGFLRSELATPAPDGTVVALHHPPIPSPIVPMAHIMLRHPEQLAEAVEGSDVRLIVCGHNHHEGFGMLGSVPVWMSPSSAYRLDVRSPEATRGVPGAAFSRIDIATQGVTASVIPIPLPTPGAL